jgi:tetratricopeptide (TPR) repeat protein
LGRTYLYEGFVYLEMGDVMRAINSATRAIEKDPTFDEAYFFRGEIKTEMIEVNSNPNQVRQEVLADFEQVVTLSPNSNLAAAAAESLSDFVLGIRDELPEDPADATDDHAVLYALRGWAHSISYKALDDDIYKTAAIADFDRVIELAPGTQVAQFALVAKGSLQAEL